jgi:hypothetical protein
MTAAAMLADITAAGVHVSRDGDALVCRPARAVPAELREELRQHKTELLELLGHPLLPPGEPVQGACFKCGAPVTWRGKLVGLRNQLGSFVHLRCPEPHRVGSCIYCNDAIYSDDAVTANGKALHHRCVDPWTRQAV